MHPFTLAAVAAGTLAIAGSAAGAQQFTIANDVACGINGVYRGPTPTCGYVDDGGYDAFDVFGLYQVSRNDGSSSIPAGITLERRTETFASRNVYRFFDTFTNTTAAPITASLSFLGNLGSDMWAHTELANDFLLVNSDRPIGSACCDPVLALVHGNNEFARTQMTRQVGGADLWSDDYRVVTTLTLAPGESRSLLFLAFLARDVGRSTLDGDVALATASGSALVNDPLLDGLSAEERSRIANFGTSAVPEPGTYTLLATGLLGLGAAARRRRAA